MYQVSEAFQAAVAKNGRTFEVELRKDGNVIDAAVMAMQYKGGTFGESRFTIGGAVASYIELTLRLPAPVLAKAEISVYIRPKATPAVEWLPMGLFTCDRPEVDGEDVSITAYDRMIKLERSYFSALTYPTSSNNLLTEISTLTGVPVNLPGKEVTFGSAPVGYTCREVVSYIAQRLGKFATIDRTGNLCFKGYVSYGASVPFGRYWDPFTRSEYDYELSGIKCIVGTQDSQDGGQEPVYLLSGNETKQVITIENPFMTQDDLDLVFRSFGSSFKFRPGNLWAMGDPTVEPGDILTIYEGETGYRVPVTSLVFDFDGGLAMEIEGTGAPESDQDVDIKGPTIRAVDRLTAQLIAAEKILARKIDADEVSANYVTAAVFNGQVANFNTLNADYAAFKSAATGRLTAIEGDFEELQTGTLTALEARIGTLETGVFSAATASIGSLSTDIANIRSLLSGTAAATSADVIRLTANNATIDSAMLRSALINVLSVSDLIAGNISTDRFTVGSDDGSFLINGSLLQIKDDDGVVRIQIGKDTTGDFTFTLYDETGNGQLINANGIQPSAVSDGLIVDRMVKSIGSGYNGISANKLNISSVIGSINSIGGLKSSSVYFDEEGQTLTQVYAQVKSTAEQSATSAAQSAQAAQAALTAIEGISTLDAFGVFLSNDAHVVHTYSDGAGGDWSDCVTTVTAVMGDTDVSGRAAFTPIPSEGVSGTWDQATRTYRVTGMSTNDGYVDFDVGYGTRRRYLLLPTGARLLMPSGGAVTIAVGAAHVTKRFSISKAPDGRVGLFYSLSASALVVKRKADGALLPERIEFSAIQINDGTASAYQGVFVIYETVNNEDYVEKYRSSSGETHVEYTISAPTVEGLRCVLLDSTGNTLDTQSVVVVADAGEIAADVAALSDGITEIQESVEQTEQRLTDIETGVDGLRLSISETKKEIHTVTDGILQWEPYDSVNEEAGTALITARVLKSGEDVTKSYPPEWYTYWKKNEEGVEYLGNGYTLTVQLDSMDFSGEVQMVFTTYSDAHLLDARNRRLLTPDRKRYVVYKS
ncbi:MAG: hypothetical protein IJ899_20840 [Blautia sp.]|nr:hypothetical protein [Blautia sp.]